jgi:signal transduction histidine kinase
MMLLVTVMIFGSAILVVSLQLRARLREQIIQRDSAVLNAIALTQQSGGNTAPEDETLLEDPLDDLASILETARFRQALAIRIYDSNGGFVTAIPAAATEGRLQPAEITSLQGGRPVHRYLADARRDSYLENVSGRGTQPTWLPVLEVMVPIPPDNPNRLVGVAQFILDGSAIAHEFAALDRYLIGYGFAVFVAGAGLLVLTLGWTFRRLNRAHAMLAERSSQLARAHQELLLSAKTSAIGAMTAHLMHGLKNPLTGLQQFVVTHGGRVAEPQTINWEDALTATQRMQNLVHDIVRVLREETEDLHYSVEPAELLEIISGRISGELKSAGVTFKPTLTARASLANHEANLVLLILENLLHNAIQATPAQHAVGLGITEADGELSFEVWDEGPGLPDGVKKRLFAPCQSTKPGGGGIGLALSKRLADQLGARLELSKDTRQGCAFKLSLSKKAN